MPQMSKIIWNQAGHDALSFNAQINYVDYINNAQISNDGE